MIGEHKYVHIAVIQFEAKKKRRRFRYDFMAETFFPHPMLIYAI